MHGVFQRALAIILLGAACGLLANTLSPRRLPWVREPAAARAPRDVITLAEAEQLWRTGAGFFLDARRTDEYVAGHIAQALSLPLEGFERALPEIEPLLTHDANIVVYCDGGECELSHDVQRRLRALGYLNVRVLVNGWTAWRKAGLPVSKGAQP